MLHVFNAFDRHQIVTDDGEVYSAWHGNPLIKQDGREGVRDRFAIDRQGVRLRRTNEAEEPLSHFERNASWNVTARCRSRAKVQRMASAPEAPKELSFQAQPLSVGNGWFAKVTLPSGEVQHIIGFRTESQVTDWIATNVDKVIAQVSRVDRPQMGRSSEHRYA